MRKLLLFGMLSAMSTSSWAHSGEMYHMAFTQGMLHPIQGWDHLLLMLALGIWSVMHGKKAMWQWPLIFTVSAVAAAILGMNGPALWFIEPAILSSLMLIGLFLACWQRISPSWAGGCVMLCALAHGYAHGLEMPALNTAWSYLSGIICASLLLYGLGIGLGQVLHRQLIRFGACTLMLLGTYSAIC